MDMPLPIILGAGVCKTPASLVPYMRDDVSLGAAITGSYTPDEGEDGERKGNVDGKNVCQWPPQIESGSQDPILLNAWGMPGPGYTKGKAQLSKMLLPKQTIVNIAAFSAKGYVDGAIMFGQNAPWVAAQEWNLSCPNAHDKKTSPISYDLGSLEEILEAGSKLSLDCPVWFKVSPYLTSEDLSELARLCLDVSNVPVFDTEVLEEVITMICAYKYVRAVVMSNAGPNFIYRVNGEPVTTPNGGKAGLSGPVMKKIVMRQVRRACAVLPKTVDAIHSGGIWYGDDVVEAVGNGAVAVETTSLPSWGGGPKVFGELIAGSEKLQEFLTN